MYEKHDNIFYYITVMNELYTHPEMPVGTEEGIIKGIYQLRGDSDAEGQFCIR
jgi:pyruvate dehydrogenase E1 component